MDRCNDDVGSQRAPGCFELHRLLPDLMSQRAVGQKGGAEEVKSVRSLDLRDENVLDESLLRQDGKAERSLALRAETQIDFWKRIVADLLAQLLPRSLQRALGARQ